ncbi:MAG: GyrI-like domain-containing protein [Planctomycetota bacterium]
MMSLFCLRVFLALVTFFFVLAGTPALAQAKADAATRARIAEIDAARGVSHLPATLSIGGTYQVFMAGMPADKPVAAGDFSEVFVGDDQARHTSEMGAFGKMERGVTPALCWEVEPSFGAKRYDGVAGATVRRYFALLRGARIDVMYAEVSAEGSQDLEGRAHHVLRMKPAAGAADTWYVDAATHLPSRIDMALPSPDSAAASVEMGETIASKLWFGDWRNVGGCVYAHRRRLEMGPATVVSTCAKIERDVEIAATRLQPPAAVTELRPKPATEPIDGDDAKAEVVQRQAQAVASIRLECTSDEISKTMAVALPEVMAQVTASGGRIAGPPFARYHTFAADKVDMEVGVPVAKPITEKGRVKNSELPGGKVATAWHIGPYDKLGGAHEALAKFARERGLRGSGGPWEIYWTDPGMVPDPQKWRTQLFLPVE